MERKKEEEKMMLHREIEPCVVGQALTVELSLYIVNLNCHELRVASLAVAPPINQRVSW